MSRLIDADKLIEEGWVLERHGEANKRLTRMSIADVPTVNQWIPVEERLPEEGEEVLITTKTSEKLYFGMYTKRYGFSMREGFICGENFMWLNTAIAWMPLPDPYRKE